MNAYAAAIAGGGFSGLMVLYHLVRTGKAGDRVAVFDPDSRLGRGLAYSTRNPRHLLNVRASNMSALPEQPDHFIEWLAGPGGRPAAESLGLSRRWDGDDYVPRSLYALYLDSLCQEAFAMARAKGIILDHFRINLVGIAKEETPHCIFAEDGRRIRAQVCVLATGNLAAREVAAHPRVIRDVWAFDFSRMKGFAGEVAIIGTGLTMVDVVIALRDAGYKGRIKAVSRNGKLPHVHEASVKGGEYGSAAAMLAGSSCSLVTLMAQFRREAKICAADGMSWQRVYDCWRPHSQGLWEGLSGTDKSKFFKRLGTLWNIHRHRMAPEIGDFVRAQKAEGVLKIISGAATIKPGDTDIEVNAGNETLIVPIVFDCRGPCYDVRKSASPLLKNLLDQGLVAPHETGVGLQVESDLRVSGSERLYAMGALAAGARLESIAIPELRRQAQDIAQSLTHSRVQSHGNPSGIQSRPGRR
jgi:uncharacterized NAD(P)/FAD-binding protein YdhS